MTGDETPMSELLDHVYAELAITDSVLQFWISITFAVIVAIHFVGGRLGRQMYLLMSGLYALVSLVSLARYIVSSIQLIHYIDILRAQHEWPVPWIYSAIAGYGTLLLLVSGSVGTLYFMHSARKSGLRSAA